MNTNKSLSHRDKEPENGVLYLVGTPIGNLNDISQRAINILKNVTLIACEDTRETRKIMNKFGLSNKLISFNKHNTIQKTPHIVNQLKAGDSIALVSDAGMPGICDPGEVLVKEAKSNGIDTICIPGPCAAITALLSSGFSSSKFIFEGFLPRKKLQRSIIIDEISRNEKTTILFESPHRLMQLLLELKEKCGGSREIQVSRELTKKFEEHIGHDIDNAINFFKKNLIIGEFTIVLKGQEKTKNEDFDKSKILAELNGLVEAGLSLNAASKYLAKKENLPKSIIYSLY